MNSLQVSPSPALYPPTVEPAERELPLGRFLWEFVQNPLRALPAAVYNDPIVVYRPRGTIGVCWITGPELIEGILSDRSGLYRKTYLEERVLHRAMGTGVLTSEGDDWLWQRRILAPLFRHSELLSYVPTMVDAAQAEIGRWNANPSPTRAIDAAMVDGAASLMTYFHGYRAGGKWPGRGRSVTGGGSPFYAVYETKDGKYISVGSAEPKFYAELLRQTGLDQAGLPDRNDPAHWPVIRERLEGVFRTRTRDEWCAQLETSETCFAPVLDMQEAAAHPHNVARGTFIEVDGLLQPAPAPRFSRTPATTPTAGVEPGVDLAAALEGWGLQAGEIQALAQAGTVA